MSSTVRVDFKKDLGRIGPINAVNNGPLKANLKQFTDLQIPYARTHDSNHCYGYGGPHIVDITAVFPDFDADENDPGSYDFYLTDLFLDMIQQAGTRVFYRLGESIEHWPKKYGTLPPRDFSKWARICEHIIRHYTEGWADGFNWDIEYWEIWNEPDLRLDDAEDKPTWGGTERQFFDFYETAAKHLKNAFPDLKIGGPAIAFRKDWAERFLTEMKKRGVQIDFFSWHRYDVNPYNVGDLCDFYRDLLDRTGYENAESILNEWNYVRAWRGDGWDYSLRAERSLKGASYATGVICVCVQKPLDMLMYYDARPKGMNGFFGEFVTELRKTYFPYRDIGVMRGAGPRAESICDDRDIYAIAVRGESQDHILLTYYNENDESPDKEITVAFDSETEGRVSFYLTDKTNDEELVRTESVKPGGNILKLKSSLFDIWHIVISHN